MTTVAITIGILLPWLLATLATSPRASRSSPFPARSRSSWPGSSLTATAGLTTATILTGSAIVGLRAGNRGPRLRHPRT